MKLYLVNVIYFLIDLKYFQLGNELECISKYFNNLAQCMTLRLGKSQHMSI